jgi:hypothetical protein
VHTGTTKANRRLTGARVPGQVDPLQLTSPHVKANLLLQAHLARAALPIADYVTDTKSVLDQAVRILQVCPQGEWR